MQVLFVSVNDCRFKKNAIEGLTRRCYKNFPAKIRCFAFESRFACDMRLILHYSHILIKMQENLRKTQSATKALFVCT